MLFCMRTDLVIFQHIHCMLIKSDFYEKENNKIKQQNKTTDNESKILL